MATKAQKVGGQKIKKPGKQLLATVSELEGKLHLAGQELVGLRGGVEQFRREYDDEIFWSELIQRLATRDFVERWGIESLSLISPREEVEKRQPFLRKYIDEFEKHGMQNLKVPE